MLGSGDRSQGIELVMHAAQSPLHLAHLIATVKDLEPLGLPNRAKVARAGTKTAQFAPAAGMQNPIQALFQTVDDHPAGAVRTGARYRSQQMVKLPFYGTQVVKYVCMVKLQIVEHDRSRPVVQKLAAFIEECGVVLIGFDDEKTVPPRAQ